MKKKFALLLAGALLMPATGMFGVNLYFYSQGNSTPSTSFTDVRKIIFSQDSFGIESNNGSTNSVATENFDYLLFYDNGGTNSLRTLSTNPITAVFNGNAIRIESSEPVAELEVYSATGLLMIGLQPGENIVTCSVSNFPDGIYIVKAVSGNQILTTKIIKK